MAPELETSIQLDPLRKAVSSGLDKVFDLTAVGHGYLEGMVGASSGLGPFARVEAGYRPLEQLAAFGFAEANRGGLLGGIGARLRF